MGTIAGKDVFYRREGVLGLQAATKKHLHVRCALRLQCWTVTTYVRVLSKKGGLKAGLSPHVQFSAVCILSSFASEPRGLLRFCVEQAS